MSWLLFLNFFSFTSKDNTGLCMIADNIIIYRPIFLYFVSSGYGPMSMYNSSTCEGTNDGKATTGPLLSAGVGSNAERLVDGENTCGLRCGSKYVVSCNCFQSVLKAKWTLAFLSSSNLMRQVVLNGLIAVTISTLEKR